MKVHEKSTYASRMNAKPVNLRRPMHTPEKTSSKKKGGIGEDTEFILTTTKGK